MDYRFSDRMSGMRGSAIREIFKFAADPEVISLAGGNPAPELFPNEELADIAAELLRNQPVLSLQYGVTEGYTPLREAVKARLKRVEHIDNADDEVIIVSGGQQGIELSAKALVNEGDTVIVEEPSFIGALNAFRSNGARPVGVPLGDDGIDPDALDRVLAGEPRARFIYLIPTFQNPSGITTSLEKRKKIYEVARRHDVLILEDNPYGELRFAGEDVPTIKSMDTDGRVIYCSSFSKILSAGMRVGYVTAPAPIISKMVVAKQVEDVHTNIFFQMLCYRYMTEYDLNGHIRDIRAIYRRKCGLMLECLERELPAAVSFTRPEGGLFVWCTLPQDCDMDAFVKQALEKRVAVVPGTAFLCDPDGKSQSFRINYSTPSDEEIREGCRRLGEAARSFGIK